MSGDRLALGMHVITLKVSKSLRKCQMHLVDADCLSTFVFKGYLNC